MVFNRHWLNTKQVVYNMVKRALRDIHSSGGVVLRTYRQRFSFPTTCYKRKSLRFYGNACFLYMFFHIPEMAASEIESTIV